MIYCGYQGVGKSTYCRNNPDTTVDLDSSNFKKVIGWEKEYIKMAEHFSNLGKQVFISAHKIVIEELIGQNIPFEVLIPAMDKLAWKSRLEFRYFKNPTIPNAKAIHDFTINYDKDMEYYNSLISQGIIVKKVFATIVTNITEIL